MSNKPMILLQKQNTLKSRTYQVFLKIIVTLYNNLTLPNKLSSLWILIMSWDLLIHFLSWLILLVALRKSQSIIFGSIMPIYITKILYINMYLSPSMSKVMASPVTMIISHI